MTGMPEAAAHGDTPVLELAALRVTLRTAGGDFAVVRGLDMEVAVDQTVALVGESGCGKSVSALAVMRLLEPALWRVDGAIRLQGSELAALDEPAMEALRGNRMGMVFQEPMTSLNPVFTIGRQVGEVLVRHGACTPRQVRGRVVDLLARVRMPSPQERVDQYPHQLSGGMRQRVMIAMAIACRPRLLIADEPTTALDVTVQAQILALLAELKREAGMSLLLITHNLALVAQYADRVCVMYAGDLVESAPVSALFAHPRHPYTRGLLACLPGVHGRGHRLPTIPGRVPPPHALAAACRFADRCPHAAPRCREQAPPLARAGDGHAVACWLHVPGSGVSA